MGMINKEILKVWLTIRKGNRGLTLMKVEISGRKRRPRLDNLLMDHNWNPGLHLKNECLNLDRKDMWVFQIPESPKIHSSVNQQPNQLKQPNKNTKNEVSEHQTKAIIQSTSSMKIIHQADKVEQRAWTPERA